MEAYTSNTNGSSITAQHISTAQLSPLSSQRSTQLQKAARCRLNSEQARSSIIAQQCWRRWAASRTGDRAPCLYDDRAQHAQASIDKHQNNSNSSNNNDHSRHHTAAQQYGTRTTIVPTPNPTATTQLARGKRSNDGYQP